MESPKASGAARMDKPIVSVSGLRGIVGETFTPDVLVPYVAAFADLCKGGKIVVGGDSRPSREWAQPLVESVLRARGCGVVRVGLAPTPTIGMMVREHRAQGAIAITASHNPIEWNGLKFFHAGGEFLTPDHHKKLEALMRKPAASKGSVGKAVDASDAIHRHLKTLTATLPPRSAGKARKLRVVVDCCNGAASIIAPLVAATYGAKPEVIFANPGRPFPRGAEPVPANITVLRREVKRFKADFGVAIDPDADRLALVDETGRAIGEERTLVLAADAWLGMSGAKSPIVVNLSTSQAIEHLARRHGCAVHRTPIGEAHVLAGMKKHKSAIGGEGNGGVILPAVHPGRDAATAFALIILGMQDRRGPLSKWNATIPDFVTVKISVDIGGLSVKQTLKRAKQLFRDAEGFDERDGLKVLLKDSFVHLRPSNTEPILRVFVEAPDAVTARSLLVQTQAVLQ